MTSTHYYDRLESPGYWRDITGHFQLNTKILDIGCSTGWVAEHFCNYTGLDCSLDPLKAARALGRNVVQGNADVPLPFADGTFTALRK